MLYQVCVDCINYSINCSYQVMVCYMLYYMLDYRLKCAVYLMLYSGLL